MRAVSGRHDVDEVAALGRRLALLGMPFDGDALSEAAALVAACGMRPEALHDIQLMTIAVEAYRTRESPELV